MEHKLFKPQNFENGKHAVVGNCNGFTMQQRWEEETPLFAKAILRYAKPNSKILDYGCGVGRLSKEIITQDSTVTVTGTDASSDMMKQAFDYVQNSRFTVNKPEELEDKFDIIYLVYVLQHVPAIEIRNILARIHYLLKDGGVLVYCSSDYRMAIRFDSPGFFDDRFLGVNLQEELSRYFRYKEELFDDTTLDSNQVLGTMIRGGLSHPAKVYIKKPINHYFNAVLENTAVTIDSSQPSSPEISPQIQSDVSVKKSRTNAKKLILANRLAPGDCLVMSNAIRDLKKAHPKYEINVRTPANELYANNPYLSNFSYDETQYSQAVKKFSKAGPGDMNPDSRTVWIDDVLIIDMQYPLIHSSGERGSHFAEGHREWLEKVLEIEIPQTSLTPELYLSQTEKSWLTPVATKTGYMEKYWVINAGSKNDFTLKQYPYYQEVVDLLKKDVQFVQIGQKSHNHKALEGTLDMVGKTNLRELIRTIYFSEGVISCVSLPMHIAAAFRKPAVIVAGAREGTRWELYPNQQFLYVNGCLPCATYDGCWKSKTKDCKNQVDTVPKCMMLIKPQHVVDSVKRYYEGGMLV